MTTNRSESSLLLRSGSWWGLVIGSTLLLGFAAALANGVHHEAPPTQLPPTLADIEQRAEDIFDLANAAQWNRAGTRTNLLRETTARLEASQGHQIPELERAIADLDRAIEVQNASRARRSANEVMRQAVRLGSDQISKDSVAILMLDVETREVLMDLDEDPQAANEAVARIASLWLGLRPEVEKRGDHALTNQCDSHLKALETGSTAIRKSEAEAFLETIDRLEDLFSQMI